MQIFYFHDIPIKLGVKFIHVEVSVKSISTKKTNLLVWSPISEPVSGPLVSSRLTEGIDPRPEQGNCDPSLNIVQPPILGSKEDSTLRGVALQELSVCQSLEDTRRPKLNSTRDSLALRAAVTLSLQQQPSPAKLYVVRRTPSSLERTELNVTDSLLSTM